MTLRVAVDATAIPGQRVGAGVYLVELLRAVQELNVDLQVFCNKRDEHELQALLPKATLHPVNVSSRPLRILWAQTLLARAAARVQPDLFFGPHYTLPRGLVCPSVVTFHDPTFFTLAELHERAKVAYFTRAARSGVARATRVIAVSEYTRDGVVTYAGAQPDRVDVVYEGVDLERYRAPDDGYDGKPYIFFVGALEPRKNVPSLVEAYDLLARDGFEHELVLAGPRAWGAPEVDEAIARATHGTIRTLGFVSDERKIAGYQHASLFVYPTIAEGFGLPVVEAMACGAPVVTTSGSAPEEVAGDAAILVPPRDTHALRDAMQRVLSSSAVAEDLRTRGFFRAMTFTWQRAAEQTFEVWRKAVYS